MGCSSSKNDDSALISPSHAFIGTCPKTTKLFTFRDETISLNLLDWKSKLLSLFSPRKCPDIPHWPILSEEFHTYINSIDRKSQISWLTNARLTNLVSPYYNSQFRAREGPKVILLDSVIPKNNVLQGKNKVFNFDMDEISPKTATSPLSDQLDAPFSRIANVTPLLHMATMPTEITLASEFSQGILSPKNKEKIYDQDFEQGKGKRNSRKIKSCNSSPKAEIDEGRQGRMIKRMELFIRLQNDITATQELSKNLLNQIGSPDHIVTRLVNVFLKRVENLFKLCFEGLDSQKYTLEHENLLKNLQEMIKHFVRVMTEFVRWIYRELIEQLKTALGEENQKAEYIIEEVIYKLLFSDSNSFVNFHIRALLRLKYKEEIRQLGEYLEWKREDKLESYDQYLVKSQLFLLPRSEFPYENVVQNIKRLVNIANPYEKMETAELLENDMRQCLDRYYQEDLEMLDKAQDFGRDAKVPIMLYCLVKTQYKELIVETAMIKMFVNKKVKSQKQSFLTFKSCLKYLLKKAREEI